MIPERATGRLRVAYVGCTRFGYDCLTQAIVGCPAVSLSGIITAPRKISFAASSATMDVLTHADFHSVAKTSDSELVELSSKPKAVDYLKILDRWRPDLMIVLGWYSIIPQEVFDRVPMGAVAIHASLLPKYRGMAPIPWAIINGEDETGVSFFHLDKGVDSGDIIAQRSFPITNSDSCATVYKKATEHSVAILKQFLPLLASGQAPRTKQNHDEATTFPRRTPADGLINWAQHSTEIHNFIRAQTHPYPGAFTMRQGRKLTIWKASRTEWIDPSSVPGDVKRLDQNLCVTTSDGSILLEQCQFEGASEADTAKAMLESSPFRLESRDQQEILI